MPRSLTIVAMTLLLPSAAHRCAPPTHDSTLREWAMDRVEALAHPARSLRVRPLRFSDVWLALPGVREHRERNSLRIDDASDSSSTYVVFDRFEPALQLADDTAPAAGPEEVNSVLLRVYRRGTGLMAGYAATNRFDPTASVVPDSCQSGATAEARFDDAAAIGWRCQTATEHLVIEVHPKCAAQTGPVGCLLVQMSVGWKDAP